MSAIPQLYDKLSYSCKAAHASALQQQWITAVRARWAGARAAASADGSDGAAWLDGDAARAAACDAMLVPW